MTCWRRIIGFWLLLFFIVTSFGAKSANAEGKLDASYTATLLGLPIGHISWALELKGNNFSSVATGSIAGCGT